MPTKFCVLILIFLGLWLQPAKYVWGQGSDTLRFSVTEAENRFLKQNLLLLANRYEIDAQKALAIQARVFANPQVQLEINLYNPNKGKWFDASTSGQFAVQISELFEIAGQRNLRYRIQLLEADKTEAGLADLLRTLRLQLRIALFSLNNQIQVIKLYDTRTGEINRIVTQMELQQGLGNISLAEVSRLRALQFTLQTERLEAQKAYEELQGLLRILLVYKNGEVILPLEPVTQSLPVSNLTLPTLVDTALQVRPDLRLARLDLRQQQLTLKYQKSSAVPNLQLGALYDNAGSYIQKYSALTAAINLPFFNRNQGYIKAAQLQTQKAEGLKNEAELEVMNQVKSAWEQLQAVEANDQIRNQKFLPDFEGILDNILRNYERRSLSLLEFLDYFQTYKDSKIGGLALQRDRYIAFENLNFAVGKPIIALK